MSMGRVIIVGAGPAGASLAYLLARRGLGVTLIERHHDFARTFRGDGLQPSGVDAFEQMGLGEKLRALPAAVIDTIDLYHGGRLRASLPTASLGFIGRFVPQPAILAMLTEEAGQFPSFRLLMGTTVRELIVDGDRVVGVRVAGSDGNADHLGDLVIGADGRYSTVRKHGRFPEMHEPQHFDVLNFKVPLPDFWPSPTTVRLELGAGSVTGGIPTWDGQLWVAMTLQKGQYKELRTTGTEGLTEELLRRTSPDLAEYLRSHEDHLKHPVLLDVIVGRLEEWNRPGLLLLGDAAHPMSPQGGQGINVALRDALVAANHLCPVLSQGSDLPAIDEAARKVVRERMPEIVAVQEHQRKQTQTFLRSDQLKSRIAMRLFPFLAKTGLLRLMLRKRLDSLQNGVVPVRLTV